MEKEQQEIQEENKEENKEEEQQEEKKDESQKDDFEKDSETVPAGKYNQALRKLREKEADERELKKQLEDSKATKPVKEESEDDIFKDEEKEKELSSLVEEKVKPILERLNQKEENDKKIQRTAFFKKHPEYLKNSEKWQELLDEMDNSLNPKSKDSFYQQLEKAHRIISIADDDYDIDNKKKEMASESSSKGDGSNKTDTTKSVDERAERLAKQMPVGFEFKK